MAISVLRVPTANPYTTGYTLAAGDDSRITGAQQRSTVTTKGDLYVATASATAKTPLPVSPSKVQIAA